MGNRVSESILEDPHVVFDLRPDKLLPLLDQWTAMLKKQRLLVDIINSSVLITGDIHGDLTRLTQAIEFVETENVDRLIINGDLIDRGAEMIECVSLVMAKQLQEPGKILFLRGNHEIRSINEIYGFRGYSTGLFGSEVYNGFSKAFQQLPLAAKFNNKGFVTHGGIPRDPIFFHLMRLEVKEPEPTTSPYAQLMWNDPDPDIELFAPSIRGIGFYRFGKQAFDEFMEFHNLDLFVRAHQAFKDGYRWFFDERLLSVFSSKAGPYSKITPHFAMVKPDMRLELINCADLD